MDSIETPRIPYIIFADVQVKYSAHVHGLRGVSLTIGQGDFVFLVGKTGAGKSTLLKCLTREVKYDGGKLLLHDRDLGTVGPKEVPGLRRGMGIVPQDYALLPRKNVYENVAYAMRAAGHSRSAVRHRVPEVLERALIAHKIKSYPHELSGGEQQRVAIARALINNPPLLLADEPTGNLDPENSLEIMSILQDLNAKGTTVIVASHDMAIVEHLQRRIVRLEDGRLISDDAPKAVVFRPDPETAKV